MQSPGSKNNSKKRAEKGPAQRLRQRTAILILLILVLGFGAAVLRLTYLTTVQSSELQESAVDLQLADTTVSAKRGTIYDANGNVLAESASVWQVVMSPFPSTELFEEYCQGNANQAKPVRAANGRAPVIQRYARPFPK